MCLNVTAGTKLLTAKQDILVYKVLRGDYTSPYYGLKYKPNTLYRLRKPLKASYSDFSYREVHEGYHSFADKNAAHVEVMDISCYSSRGTKIVEFFIPKGAKYYKGKYNTFVSYVSTSIRSGSLKEIKD